MTGWWIALGVAGAVAAGCLAGLFHVPSRKSAASAFMVVPASIEAADPLLHSQIAASLMSLPNLAPRQQRWRRDLGEMHGELHEIRRDLRTLQTYVLALDERYVRLEQASWLNLQVFLLVIGSLGAAATLTWAAIELFTGH